MKDYTYHLEVLRAYISLLKEQRDEAIAEYKRIKAALDVIAPPPPVDGNSLSHDYVPGSSTLSPF